MKKLTFALLLGTYAISSISCHAGIVEDAQEKANEVKKQAEAVGKTIVERGKEVVEDTTEALTGKKAAVVAEYISTSVQGTSAFQQAEQNPSLVNKACVEVNFAYFAALATQQHCVIAIDSFPFRKIKCGPCKKGLRQAHKELFEKIAKK